VLMSVATQGLIPIMLVCPRFGMANFGTKPIRLLVFSDFGITIATSDQAEWCLW
jgi:hypothetical protein